MAGAARTRAWHECLYKLAPNRGPLDAKAQKQFEAGWGVHGVIEKMFPTMESESKGRYAEPGLPFAIEYHPDVWDKAGLRVWEIKPVGWFLSHYDYCLAQLSGYRHFTRASLAGFMLYRLRRRNGDQITLDDVDGPWPYVPPFFFSWDYLKTLATESDALLLRQGR
jgi:hypothetical protein